MKNLPGKIDNELFPKSRVGSPSGLTTASALLPAGFPEVPGEWHLVISTGLHCWVVMIVPTPPFYNECLGAENIFSSIVRWTMRRYICS